MPLHITMRQLQVFEAVARHLSFTRAAQELHLTQPAVSMQVKQLESILELPLFERLGKTIHLTKAGRTMLRHSRAMMSQLVEIDRDVRKLKGANGGKDRKERNGKRAPPRRPRHPPAQPREKPAPGASRAEIRRNKPRLKTPRQTLPKPQRSG